MRCFDFAQAIERHGSGDLHRLAADVFHSPQAHLLRGSGLDPSPPSSPPLTASSVIEKYTKVAREGFISQLGGDAAARLSQAGSVLDIFRGVPPLKDWLDVWAECSSCISMYKQARVAGKKLQRLAPNRKSRRKLISIISEVVREGIRKRLRSATSATVALDDWRGRKILRVRVDTPEAPYSYDGVLGVVRKSYGSHGAVADDIAEDHAQHSLRRIEHCHRRFFTPLASKKRKASSRSASGDAPVCD